MSHPLLEFMDEHKKELSPLLILTHDHPDPDCMATAMGLAYIAEKRHGIRARIVHAGLLGRMENQTMVRLLRVPIRPLRERDLARRPSLALVDTQPPFQNNPLPSRQKVAMVVDHHPRHPRTQADFVWIEEEAGAASTMMTEALAAAELEIPRRLAAALAYGIVSETENLGREAGPRDVQAYRELIQKADPRVLAKIQTPQRPKAFFEVLGRAIRNAFVHKTVIGVHLGPVPHPDRVSQVADFLLTLEKMRWSICTGRYEGRLHVSVRARNPKAHAGRLLRRLLNGSGGGHSMVAGGAVELPGDSTEEQWNWKEEELTLGFLGRTGHREPFELTYPFRGD